MNVPKEKILEEARALLPWRQIGLGEAKLVAERQANLLLKLLRIHEVPVDVFRLTELANVVVEVRPRYLMGDISARTKSTGSRHHIVINQNEPLGRRRLTLAHEFKHLLDDRHDRYVYANLGLGNDEVHDRLVEQICDHFAACFLMPKSIIRRAWSSGIHEPEALADLFGVSASAMILRLRYLGFSAEPPKPAREYFKRVAPPIPDDVGSTSLPATAIGKTARLTPLLEMV